MVQRARRHLGPADDTTAQVREGLAKGLRRVMDQPTTVIAKMPRRAALQILNPATPPCQVCEGKKRIQCSHCMLGVRFGTCPCCDHECRKKCDQCDGNGIAQCYGCRGHGVKDGSERYVMVGSAALEAWTVILLLERLDGDDLIIEMQTQEFLTPSGEGTVVFRGRTRAALVLPVKHARGTVIVLAK